MASMELFLPNGTIHDFKKATPPPLGEKFGVWSGSQTEMLSYMTLPGGGMLMFDLSKLTLQDFRQMRDHYQVGISLWILTFMLHQIDWRIECDDKRIGDAVSENFSLVWTPLIRAMSQAFWAGFSPNVLQWENDISGRRVVLDKVKDLIPEMCSVNWKEVDGYSPPNSPPPKIQLFDGIKQQGSTWPVPADCSLWYPLLMENGNFSGRKLLRPAFPAWFFSQLIHLFANRYFERFGEPLPVGRYPSTWEGKDANNNPVTGRKVMEDIVTGIRNRSVVVVPSDRNPDASAAAGRSYEWDLEYLESQMRGADFERYMTRLDEEISLALFTPVLLYRTADVGSYNLGDAHFRLFMSMLNALAGDIKHYIDKYVLDRMVDFNFGTKAARARWVPRRLGKDTPETLRAALQGVISQGLATLDLDELSVALGIGVHEREILMDDPTASPGGTPGDTPSDETGTGGTSPQDKSGAGLGGKVNAVQAPSGATRKARALMTLDRMFERGKGQIKREVASGAGLPARLDLGHQRQLADAMGSHEAMVALATFDAWWAEYAMTTDDADRAITALKNVLASVGDRV